MKPIILLLPTVLVLLGTADRSLAQRSALPSDVIAFAHEDTGSPDPQQQVFNLRLMDPQDPGRQAALTEFTVGPTGLGALVWSRDHRRLAFAGNLNGPASLEAESVFTINGDGTGLRQITGFGVLGQLPGPTGTVTGRVEAPALDVLGRQLLRGTVVGCVVGAQGTRQTATCGTDGSFVLRNVPVGAAWVRAQGDVSYFDPNGLVPTREPGSSSGFAFVTVQAGQLTDVGTITLRPVTSRSVEPSWSRDGTHLLVTHTVSSKSIQRNGTTGALEWRELSGTQLQLWTADGRFVREVRLPELPHFSLFGADWSPVEDRIACSATAASTSEAYLGLLNPDGSNVRPLYQVPLVFGLVQFVRQCRWSPDGRQIAFIQMALPINGSAGWSNLFVINADGSGLRQLTDAAPTRFVYSPTWSPDGEFLAFGVAAVAAGFTAPGSDIFATRFTAEGDIFAIRPDGTGLARLTNDRRSFWPAW